MSMSLAPPSHQGQEANHVMRIVSNSTTNHHSINAMMNAAQPSSKSLRIPCLYTKQVQKKRKVWSDGVLRVTNNKGIVICTLIDAEDVRSIGLESRQLVSAEVTKLMSKQTLTIGMDNHLIEVSFEQQKNESINPPLKIAKFVPPSRIAAPPSVGVIAKAPAASSSAASKRSLDEELDDLWGISSTAPSTSMSTNTSINASGSLGLVWGREREDDLYSVQHQLRQHKPSRTAQAAAPAGPPIFSIKKASSAPRGNLKIMSSAKTNDSTFCDWIDDSFYNIHDSSTPHAAPALHVATTALVPAPALAAGHSTSQHFDIDSSIWD